MKTKPIPNRLTEKQFKKANGYSESSKECRDCKSFQYWQAGDTSDLCKHPSLKKPMPTDCDGTCNKWEIIEGEK
jgi:hypothetical protein